MIDTVLSTRGATYADIQRIAEELIFEGYDSQQLLHQLLDFYIDQPSKNINDRKKARISEIIAEADF